mgnify:FL=1
MCVRGNKQKNTPSSHTRKRFSGCSEPHTQDLLLPEHREGPGNTKPPPQQQRPLSSLKLRSNSQPKTAIQADDLSLSLSAPTTVFRRTLSGGLRMCGTTTPDILYQTPILRCVFLHSFTSRRIITSSSVPSCNTWNADGHTHTHVLYLCMCTHRNSSGVGKTTPGRASEIGVKGKGSTRLAHVWGQRSLHGQVLSEFVDVRQQDATGVQQEVC